MEEIGIYQTVEQPVLNLEPIKIKIGIEELQILQDVLIACSPINTQDKSMNIVFSSIVKEIYQQVSTKVFFQKKNLKLKAHEAIVLKQLLKQPNQYGVFEAAVITKIIHQIDQFYV